MSYNIDDIIRQVREAVGEAMNGEIKEKTKEIVSKNAKTIYSYKPKHPHLYTRRRDGGGLSDKNNVKVQVQGKGNGFQLEAENKTTGRAGFSGLTEVVEYGTGGNWRGIVPARPFMDKAGNELEQQASNILKKSLRAKGLKAE